MNLTIVLEGLQQDLQNLGELGDERSAQVAQRLGEALGSNLRLKLLDLFSQVAVELSSKLPSGHIEVRLAGQEPELVFVDVPGGDAGGMAGEELSARISLRLPESLKGAVEKAADREGVSTNAWLVRAIARAAESRPAQVSGKRLSGYAQS
jgi:Ribbon-helix-helix protein, copG family